MIVQKSNNSELPFVMHREGSVREFSVNFLEHSKNNHIFSYEEPSVKEFKFKGDFAISGSDDHGMFGVVKDKKFYWESFSKWAKVFAGNSPFWERKQFNDTINLLVEDKKRIKFNGNVNLWFSIGQYWHWFCEDIPLIEQLRTNAFPIITNKLHGWQRDSLSFFPDIQKRIIEVDTPCVIDADFFHTFTFPAVSYRGKTSRWVPLFLKESFKPSTTSLPSDLIYISRGDAVARCVENESEVKKFLISKGFKCYNNFSQMSIQEKVNAFNSARLVIAPTGSNLTHCHAMQSGTTVLDFNHEFELEAECGWNSIGTGVGINWYTFPAITGSIGPRSKNGKKQKNNNLIVDLEKLSRALLYVLDQRL